MLNKEIIKDIIVENQKFATSMRFVERQYAFEDGLNYVLVGLRRAGKSYLMYQRIQQLMAQGHSAEEILYFNFEDDRLDNILLSDLDDIKTCYEAMFDYQPIFFLDEIQIVDGWEKFARRLADQKYRVYITGSNAKMLSSEIATTLGGRFVVKNIYPFSFAEYLQSEGVNVDEKNALYKYKKEIVRSFETFFQFGGLPEVQSVQDKRQWLSGLFNKIFFGDLVARYAIRNDYALRLLTKKLAESVKQPVSYNRLARIISSAGKKIAIDTIIEYVQYMHDSWLLLPVENINAKLAERSSNRKYYFIDNGILNLFLIDPNSSLLENIVAIGLHKKYETDFYYYQNGVEVDFYIPETETAIQVSYSLRDEETRRREVSALEKMAKQIKIEQMIIITKDEEETIEANDYEIQVIPIWKWLLAK